MKRWGVMLVLAAGVACAKSEKREENEGMSRQAPAMSADTTHAAADTTMLRDTARVPAKR